MRIDPEWQVGDTAEVLLRYEWETSERTYIGTWDGEYWLEPPPEDRKGWLENVVAISNHRRNGILVQKEEKSVNKELSEFKIRLFNVAMKAKKRYGWYDEEIDELLEELEVPMPRQFAVGDHVSDEETRQLPPGTVVVSKTLFTQLGVTNHPTLGRGEGGNNPNLYPLTSPHSFMWDSAGYVIRYIPEEK